MARKRVSTEVESIRWRRFREWCENVIREAHEGEDEGECESPDAPVPPPKTAAAGEVGEGLAAVVREMCGIVRDCAGLCGAVRDVPGGGGKTRKLKGPVYTPVRRKSGRSESLPFLPRPF